MVVSPDLRARLLSAACLTAAVLIGCQASPTPEPTATATPTVEEPTSVPTVTPRPTNTPTAVPVTLTATPTHMPPPYRISVVDPEHGLGIANLRLVPHEVTTPVVDADELRQPSPTLVPDSGRFGLIHYTLDLIHLGSDFLNPPNDTLISPHEEAILVGMGYLRRSTYVAIALDISGEFQMYQLMIDGPDGPRPYVIIYAHFEDGSNATALAQAQANEGHVERMGRISRVGPDDPNLSDFHIAVLDMQAVRAFTGAETYHEGLRLLFTDQLPRDNQQYPSIFVAPETIFPALNALVMADPRWGPTPTPTP